MGWFDEIARGLGTANAPFGFAPVSPSQGAVDPAYNAGMEMIGNIGMGMLASGTRNPVQALGRSYLAAQNQAQEKNKHDAIAAEMLKSAADKKAAREEEQAAQQQREAFIKTLPPDVQMKARSIPGYLDSYIQATDPNLQRPSEPHLYNVGGALVNANGQVVYQGQAGGGISADIEGRKAAATQLGLSSDDPAYKSYILTGKMPREDQAPLTATDKKAILDADESVQANTQAIDMLNSVITPDKSGKSLNDRAGYGATAGMQSWLARNDATGIFDDATGQATTELQNIILNNALGSLKSIFGGNPTEGERAILLDLQASVDKTPKERKPIIERAIAAAKRRLVFNQQRADELRGGTYYKAGGGKITTPDGYTIEQVGD